MKREVKDYLVQYEPIDSGGNEFVHFVSDMPVNSVGFYDDLYEAIYEVLDEEFRIISIEEGF